MALLELRTFQDVAKWTSTVLQPGHQQSLKDLVGTLCTADPMYGHELTRINTILLLLESEQNIIYKSGE